MPQGQHNPFSQTAVHIYQLDGTRQFIVSTGKEEYSFLSEADAQRFAATLTPQTQPIHAQAVPVGSSWDKWSSTPTVSHIQEL